MPFTTCRQETEWVLFLQPHSPLGVHGFVVNVFCFVVNDKSHVRLAVKMRWPLAKNELVSLSPDVGSCGEAELEVRT